MREQPWVELEGNGIAAVCIARLLSDADVAYRHLSTPSPRGVILLSTQTQTLLRGLFPPSASFPHDLFAGFHMVRRRVVLWGSASEPLHLPHDGVTVSEAELLERLWQRVPDCTSVAGQYKPAFRIETQRSTEASASIAVLTVGRAEVSSVQLCTATPHDACWMESVEGGWLFLLSCGGGAASLIAAGGATAALLATSRLVASQIMGQGAIIATIPYQPGIARDVTQHGCIRCGSAAMRFDPLCGEGAGNSVREAYLAAAVLRASFAGESQEALRHHYADRLTRGFLRHLEICTQFYSTGGSGAFWKEQAKALHYARSLVLDTINHRPAASFRLVDRDLVPVYSSVGPVS